MPTIQSMEFLTPQEVAAKLKVRRLTVYVWIQKQILPNAVKVGKQWRIPQSDIDQILKGELNDSD